MAVCLQSQLLLRNIATIRQQFLIARACSFIHLSKQTNDTSSKPQSIRGLPLTSLQLRSHHVASGSVSHLLKRISAVTLTRGYAKKGKEKGGKAHKKVELTGDQLDGLVDMERLKHDFDHVMDDLKDKFIHQLTLRTSQGAFDNLIVKTPDGNFPLIQLGQVVQKSPQLLAINMAPSPQYITHVKEALGESGLNINPQQDGTSLFIPLPKVTREHRETMAKNAKTLSEKSKKQLRDIYSKYSRKIKSSKAGHSSDDLIAADDMVKNMMHDMLKNVEDMTAAKQQELMGGK